MKKTIKISLLIIFMTIMLFALTGCGKSKIVATKSTKDDFMSYDETLEITLKNNKPDKITWTLDFYDESTATLYATLYKSVANDTLEIKQDGKKLTLTMDKKFFAEEFELDEKDLTKDKLIDALEEKGYTIE